MVRRKHVAVRDPDPEPETETETESEPESESEPQPQPQPRPRPPVETSEEEETLGDSESPGTPPSPNVSDFVVKPISPARRVSFSVASKPTSSKRKSQATEEDNGGDGESDKKRTKISASVPFLKVWNKEDEICLLQGMLEFHKAKGVHPSTKMGAFHEFINGKLSVDKSKVQVYEKVRRLKEKYFKRFGKENVFSDAHDSEIFKISEKIWGCEVGEKKEAGKLADKTVKEGRKKGLVKVDKIAEEGEKDVDARVNEGGRDFQSKYPYLYRSFDNDRYLRDDQKMYMRENLSLIDSSKTKAWDERWKNLFKQEGELLRMKSSLMEELTDEALDSLKQR